MTALAGTGGEPAPMCPRGSGSSQIPCRHPVPDCLVVDGIRDLRDEHGRLAYAVRGSGPPLVFIPDLFIPIDALDDDPPFAQLLDGLASFATVVVMDRSGIGFSDPIADWDRPIFDTWADDVVRVLEGVVGGPATVFGFGVQSGLTRCGSRRSSPGSSNGSCS